MQVLVVGAGVVGLAVARAAACAGHEVIVAEAAAAIGTGVSSRNSEVIHAGIYYPTGSRRALLCARSRRMLYDFCASHGVPAPSIDHSICRESVTETAEVFSAISAASARAAGSSSASGKRYGGKPAKHPGPVAEKRAARCLGECLCQFHGRIVPTA